MHQGASFHDGALAGIPVLTSWLTRRPPSASLVLFDRCTTRRGYKREDVPVSLTPTALRQTRGGSGTKNPTHARTKRSVSRWLLWLRATLALRLRRPCGARITIITTVARSITVFAIDGFIASHGSLWPRRLRHRQKTDRSARSARRATNALLMAKAVACAIRRPGAM